MLLIKYQSIKAKWVLYSKKSSNCRILECNPLLCMNLRFAMPKIVVYVARIRLIYVYDVCGLATLSQQRPEWASNRFPLRLVWFRILGIQLEDRFWSLINPTCLFFPQLLPKFSTEPTKIGHFQNSIFDVKYLLNLPERIFLLNKPYENEVTLN